MRDPYEVLGCRGALALRHQERLSQASPRSTTPIATPTIRRLRRVFPRSTPPTRSSATRKAQGFRSRRNRRRRQAALSGFSGRWAGGPGGRAGPGGFENYTFRSGNAGGPGGFAGAGGFEDILNSMFGGAQRGARQGGGSSFEYDTGGIGLDLDLNVAMTVSLEESFNGAEKKRVRLRRQGAQRQGPRRRHRRPADPPQGAGRNRARPSSGATSSLRLPLRRIHFQGRWQRLARRSSDHAL